ncbi:tyrosine-protein phosphatase [Aquamicrobium terrae]|uniref:tyrosine-protein phosphatase n=1 Tax=Aquamicrobium terrae TaxID=1324945 RepID=UPI003F492A5D
MLREPILAGLRRLRVLLAVLLGAPALMGAHMGVQQLLGNFHEVIPGEFYRSGQPDHDDVAHYAERYGIRTILNLRDEKPDAEALAARAEAERHGIRIIDYPMSSARRLPVAKAKELAALMRDAPKPLLVHCDHGANRTGLASAIYAGAVAGHSEMAAEFQLSPYYGHVPIEGLGRYEMYRSWDRFEETIGF